MLDALVATHSRRGVLGFSGVRKLSPVYGLNLHFEILGFFDIQFSLGILRGFANLGILSLTLGDQDLFELLSTRLLPDKFQSSVIIKMDWLKRKKDRILDRPPGNRPSAERTLPHSDDIEDARRKNEAYKGAQTANSRAKEKEKRSSSNKSPEKPPSGTTGYSCSSASTQQHHHGHPPSLHPGYSATTVSRRPIDGCDPRAHWGSGTRRGSDNVAELETPMTSTVSVGMVSSMGSETTRSMPSLRDKASSYLAYKPATLLPDHSVDPFSDRPGAASPQEIGSSSTGAVELPTDEATGKKSKHAPEVTISNLRDPSGRGQHKDRETTESESSDIEYEDTRGAAVSLDRETAALMAQANNLAGDFSGENEESDAESTRAVASSNKLDKNNTENKAGENNPSEDDSDSGSDSDSGTEKGSDLPIQGTSKPSPSKLRKPNPDAPNPVSALKTSSATSSPPPSPPSNQNDLERSLDSKIKTHILHNKHQELVPEGSKKDVEAYVDRLLEKYTDLHSGLKDIKNHIQNNGDLRVKIKATEDRLGHCERRLIKKKGQLLLKGRENNELRTKIGDLEMEKRDLEAEYREHFIKLQRKVDQAEELSNQLVERYEERLKDEEENHRNQWHNQQDRLRREKEKLIADNEEEIKRITNVLNGKLEANRVDFRRDLSRVSADLKKEREDIVRRKAEWDQVIVDIETTQEQIVGELRAQLARKDTEWETKWYHCEEKYRKETKGMEALHDRAMEESQTEWKKKEDAWQDRFNNIDSQHQLELREQKARLESRISEQNRKYNNLKQTSEEEKARIRDDGERRLRESEDSHKAIIKSMQEEFETKLKETRKHLKNDNEKLKRALVQRDHVKGLTDPQLESLFQRLEIQLLDFSKMIRWDSKRQSKWPISENALQEFVNSDGNSGPKRLKQHIILSCAWVLLFEKIFATPFKVFGEEGEALHRKWTDKFGKGECYTPRMTLELEWSTNSYRSLLKRCIKLART